MFTENFRNEILINPIREGADSLKIISGYATPAMASWHIKEIAESLRGNQTINITLIVGMTKFDGISLTAHNGFKNIMARNNTPQQSNFICQYVVDGAPVHSKLYLWEKEGKPLKAFMGSANYTQTAFSSYRRELLQNCDSTEAENYFDLLEKDTIYCNHGEVEEYVTLTRTHPILDNEDTAKITVNGAGLKKVTLSLLSKTGEVGIHSGLNWGQRVGRNPNQAYIPLSVGIARSGFFPLNKQHFSVLTDDGVNLILRVEQQNDKAITTPLNNSLLGEYFRNRLGLSNGAYIARQDLENYGRTDVTFYRIDEEQFFMDFSV